MMGDLWFAKKPIASISVDNWKIPFSVHMKYKYSKGMYALWAMISLPCSYGGKKNFPFVAWNCMEKNNSNIGRAKLKNGRVLPLDSDGMS